MNKPGAFWFWVKYRPQFVPAVVWRAAVARIDRWHEATAV